MRSSQTERPIILVVVDDERIRTSLEGLLDSYRVQIATAASVAEAHHLMNEEMYDVLLSDWRLTEVGGGLTVVSALHNKNPDALTLVYTGYADLKRALDTVLSYSDEDWVKPMVVPVFPELVNRKTKSGGTPEATCIERVATILENDVLEIVVDWLGRVEHDDELTLVHIGTAERIGQYPRMVWEVARRLRSPREHGVHGASDAAVEQGKHRQCQGYSMGMIVEEFRLLKLSIFESLYNGLNTKDFRVVLADAQTITDECDCQLRLTLASFTRQALKRAA